MEEFPTLRMTLSADEIAVPKRVPELIRVPAFPALHGIVLAKGLFEMPTHYNGSLTRLCVGPETCSLCKDHELRIYHLLALLNRNDGTVSWVQLTPDPARSLLQQIREAQRPLYGSTVKVGRVRKHISAPIYATLDPYANAHGNLPKPVDPSETIARCFGSIDPARIYRRKLV
jgi:hypothetical protein